MTHISDGLNPSRVVISAPHRSSGKTTLTIGLCAALTEGGRKVQPFKKGPDFIDPMWHAAASGRDCHNLDLFMMDKETAVYSFHHAARGADISIIEGNMGLYDGMEITGEGSTAELSRLLKAPVILIVDASSMTRSIAPLINGFLSFEPGTSIAGVILNKVAGGRHDAKLRAAIDHYCDVEVVGSIPRLPELGILQRHLGLRPAREDERASSIIESIKNGIKDHIDLEALVRIAGSGPALPAPKVLLTQASPVTVRLGVARDRAFTFYYPENIEALERAGAELVPFSPLEDRHLPEVDALYIGGGFPEVFMKELAANRTIREEIRAAIEKGMPVYAECGGLMYLSRGISWNGATSEMVGALPCDIRMHEKPRGHGYVKLQPTGNSWLDVASEIRAHEFHYSEAVNLGDVDFAYKVLRGKGVGGSRDGILYKNVVASYAHLHSLGTPQWAEHFVAFINEAGSKTRSVAPTEAHREPLRSSV